MLEFAMIMLIGFCCSAICRADKRYRKEQAKLNREHRKQMQKIARQEHIKYVPIDTSNVINLSSYRKRKQSPA